MDYDYFEMNVEISSILFLFIGIKNKPERALVDEINQQDKKMCVYREILRFYVFFLFL